jgi:hypothetical protein
MRLGAGKQVGLPRSGATAFCLLAGTFVSQATPADNRNFSNRKSVFETVKISLTDSRIPLISLHNPDGPDLDHRLRPPAARLL